MLRAVDYARPRNWRKDLWELDPEDPENNGLQESILQNFVVTTDGSFLKNSHPFFHLFQTNITIFIAIIYEKIQYTVLGFEPTTFRLRVSSHNHKTMAFRLQLMASCLSYDSFRVGLKNEFTLFGRIYSCVVNRADGCDKNVLHSGSQNEDLMIWMRTAALPSFRKLYRRISHVGDLEAGLPDTRFKFVIDYNFNVKPFSGTKSVVISKSSFFGALNYFIGIAFLIFGGILGPKTIKHFLLRPSSFSGLLHGIIFLNWDNTGLS